MYANQNVFIYPMLMFRRGLPRKFNLNNFRTAPDLYGISKFRLECLKGAKERRMKSIRTTWEEAGRGGTDVSLLWDRSLLVTEYA